MDKLLLHGGMWAGLVCLGLIVAIAALRFTGWAVHETVDGSLRAASFTARFILASGVWLAGWVQACVAYVLSVLALLMLRAARRAAGGFSAWSSPLFGAVVGRLEAFRDGLRHAEPDRPEARQRAEPRWGDGEAESDADAADEPSFAGASERNVYDEALALFGLEDVDPLTEELVRARYRELIKRVHPDKGMPTQAFAKQINAAIAVIKKVHGWR